MLFAFGIFYYMIDSVLWSAEWFVIPTIRMPRNAINEKRAFIQNRDVRECDIESFLV